MAAVFMNWSARMDSTGVLRYSSVGRRRRWSYGPAGVAGGVSAWQDSISPSFFAVTGKRSGKRNLHRERLSLEVGTWVRNPA